MNITMQYVSSIGTFIILNFSVYRTPSGPKVVVILRFYCTMSGKASALLPRGLKWVATNKKVISKTHIQAAQFKLLQLI